MKKLLSSKRRTQRLLKFDLKMKLSILCIFLALFSMKANDSYGQNARITINLDNVTVSEFIDEVEGSTEFEFVFKVKSVDLNRVISVNARKIRISDVLKRVFRNTETRFNINGNRIYLLKKDKTEIIAPELRQSVAPIVVQNSISGTVTDVRGMPLAGANIIEKGTSNGTQTDFDGNFTITVQSGATLVFSYIGFLSKEVLVENQTSVDVSLTEDAGKLDEVVVVGYGSKKKRDLTGAVSTISSDDLANVVTPNPELAIQGKLPGVFVSNPGSNPNARPQVRIRGVGTLGFNDPLYVIDGVPVFEGGATSLDGRTIDIRGNVNVLNLINPNDIESISVLKDASATAIYGVRASNGVILIETKRGKKGKTKFDFSQKTGISILNDRYEVLNTQQYVDIANEAWENNTSITREDDVFGVLYDLNSPEYLGDSPTYDWQGAGIKNMALLQDYNLSISGGGEKSNFAFGLGYSNQEDILFTDEMERYSMSINSDHNLGDWLKIGQSYRLSIVRQIDRNAGGRRFTFFNTFGAAPWQPIFDLDGPNGFALPGRTIEGNFQTRGYGTGTTNNFLARSSFFKGRRNLVRNLGSVYAEVKPIKNFRVRGTVSVDYFTNLRERFTEPETNLFSREGGVLSPLGYQYSEVNSNNFNLVNEFLVGYANTFGNHSLDVIFNFMDQRTNFGYSIINGFNVNFTSFDQRRLDEALPSEDRAGSIVRNRAGLQGYLGRLSYNFNSKYYLDATVRRDGSSKFGPGFKWGTFPAAGIAWRISSEKFMENLGWINDLKLRAGYGETGNQETRDFAFLSLVNQNPSYAFGSNGNPGEGNIVSGVALGDFPVEDTTWETVISKNLGLDATLFNNELSIVAEYYHRETQDILQQIDIPLVVGALTQPVVNLATVENQGFEFDLNYNHNFGELGFNANLNLTTVRNRVTSLFNNTPQNVTFPGGSGILDNDQFVQGRVEVGFPIGYIFGYQTDGIFQTQAEVDEYLATTSSPGNTSQLAPGDLRFKDLYGQPTEADGEFAYRSEGADGVVDNLDQTYLGKTIPGYYYGLGLNFDYKGFDLGLTFRGVGDVQRVNEIRKRGESVFNIGSNYLTSILDRWTPENPSNVNPRVVVGDPSGNNRISDRFVEDADFFRLQNMELGYTFSPAVLDQMGISNLRVYTAFSNVFVITPYTGLDPENDTTPFVFTTGVNLSF